MIKVQDLKFRSLFGMLYFNLKYEGDNITKDPKQPNLHEHRYHVDQPQKLNRRHKKGRTLNDALWTAKPYIQRKLQNTEKKNHVNQNNRTLNIENLETDIRTVTSSGTTVRRTTPLTTDKPTTPITTQSITTPIYTEAPTQPITTQSITTPTYTEPGHRDVTTEGLDPVDEVPNETLRLIRQRRQVLVTPTSPNPITTSVKPSDCGDGTSYVLSNGQCVCGNQYKGYRCTETVSEEEQQQMENTCVEFIITVMGEFDNTSRADFHVALEEYYSDMEGYQRMFVFPLMYNATSNTTTVNYIVCFEDAATASDINKASSITTEIVTGNFPLLIKSTTVTLAENDSFYVRQTVDGEIELVPLGTEVMQNPCYIYDKIDACKSNGGKCEPRNGTAVCICPDGYMGPYCDREVLYAAEDTTMEVLLPVLVALAGLAMCCSCCWLCCRRVGKGDDEYSTLSTYTSSIPPVILPRYHPYQFKQFIAGAEFEEEENAVPVIIERQIIQPIYVEKVAAEETVAVVKPRPVRVERVIKEEIIRRPVVVERVIADDVIEERVVRDSDVGGEVIQERIVRDGRVDLSDINVRTRREFRDRSDSGSSTSSADDLSWMFGQQSHDRFKIRRPSVNSKADSRFNYFDSKYTY